MNNKCFKNIVLWTLCILLSILGETTLAAEPGTGAYTLKAQVVAISSTFFLAESSVDVPFNSYIVGVTFSAKVRKSPSCFASLEYPNASSRPDGSNTNMIARTEIPFISNTTPHSAGSFYVPVPKMFIREGVSLVLKAGGGPETIITEDVSFEPACTVLALVHLIPLNPGVVSGTGRPILSR